MAQATLDVLVGNQIRILRNQEAIVKNQKKIISNQTKILRRLDLPSGRR